MFDFKRASMDNDVLVPGEEKMQYPIFRRDFVSYRGSQLASQLVTFSRMELPTNAVLHLASHLLTPTTTGIDFDVTDPLIRNEHFAIYVDTVLDIPEKNSLPFGIVDRYMFMKGRYQPLVKDFFNRHPMFHRVTDRKAAIHRANALLVLNYNAILQARVTGMGAELRLFDILLRTILDNIHPDDGRHHVIEIPLSDHVYSYTQVSRTFRKFDQYTAPFRDDMSFFMIAHLIGFLAGSETSLFGKLTPDLTDRLNLVFTCHGNAVTYNLGDLKHLVTNESVPRRVLNHLNLLKLSTDPEMVADIQALNPEAVDTMMHQAARPDPQSGELVDETALVDSVKNGQGRFLTEEEVTARADRVIAENPGLTADEILAGKRSPVEKPGVLVVEATPIAPVPTPGLFAETLRTKAMAAIDTRHDFTEAQKQRARQLYERQMALEFGGRSLGEHIALLEQQPAVESASLEHLADKLPDRSMMTSSIASHDRVYVKHQMNRDAAAVLTSFSAQGMFVSKIEERDEVTQLNRIRHVRVTLTDLNGKNHTIPFKWPHIDNDGNLLVNGITSRMTKQQVGLPIFKVSPTRVNLSSAYNKTLVERSTTKTHSFDSWIAKYIAQLRTKGKIQTSYGRSTASRPLASDYTAVAKTYTRIVVPVSLSPASEEFSPQIREASADDAEAIEMLYLEHLGDTPDAERTAYLLASSIRSGATDGLHAASTPDGTVVGFTKIGELPAITAGLESFEGSWQRQLEAIATDQEFVSVGMEALDRSVLSGDWTLIFDYQSRFTDRGDLHVEEDQSGYGILFGSGPGDRRIYIDLANIVRVVTPNNAVEITTTLVDLLELLTEVSPPSMVSEWTELKLQDKNFPLAFVLGYRFGLSNLMTHLGIGYRFYTKESGVRPTVKTTEIVIPFSDGKLVIDRYPLDKSLIIAGLDRFDTKLYEFAELDNSDTYFRMLADHGIGTNYLKGINGFFDFFIDPLTADVLRHMGEPVELRDLLIRATQMLTTSHVIPQASMANHRLRGYERFSAILYGAAARAVNAHNSQRGHKRGVSLNPQDVFLRIMQDPTITVVETINPIHDIKGTVSVTYTGAGGRTARSFVVPDRKYPDDGVGILSECTPDSGKVAISTYTTMDPVIANVRGMFDIASVNPKTIPPTKLLSPTSLLMPGVTQDD